MGRYRVREIDGEEEASEIRALHDACFGSEAPAPETGKGYWWFVEFWDHFVSKWEPIGFAQLKQSVQYLNVGYLARSGVLPWHRGHRLQRRLIRARERKARNLGWVALVSDTSDNPASANNLIAAGYRQYWPTHRWAFKLSNYWIKWLVKSQGPKNGRDPGNHLQPQPDTKVVHRKPSAG